MEWYKFYDLVGVESLKMPCFQWFSHYGVAENGILKHGKYPKIGVSVLGSCLYWFFMKNMVSYNYI